MVSNKSLTSMANNNRHKSWKEYMQLLILVILPLFSGAQLINNGANIIIAGPTTIVLNDLSFQNNGSFNQSAGIVSFTGPSPAIISGTNPLAFFQLGINKPGSSLQLQTDISIQNQLQFTDGLIHLNNKNILLDPAALLTGEKETSRITGTTGGYVQITKTLNAPAAEDPGNLGVIITSPVNLGSVLIRRGHQSQINPAGGGNSILRYYDIIPINNSALNATLRLDYFDGELNGLNENNLNVWKRNANGTWTDLVRSSGSVATNYVERTGIADFTRFTLSNSGNTLPLIWSSFNTQCTGSTVRIGWKTEQEQNTLQFIIRRSLDARNWITIATLPAAGNSNTAQSYSYNDQQSSSGPVYYQIQQQDIDGRLTVSPVLLSNCNAVEELKVFPNPVLNECWVSLQLSRGGSLLLQLFDSKGALVQMRQESVRNGNNQFRLQMQNLAKGIYTLIVKQPDGNIKVVKLEKN
jgi:hypothetical protein